MKFVQRFRKISLVFPVRFSAFGFGGSIAHLVLEEFDPGHPGGQQPAPVPQLFVLSAKTQNSLRTYVENLSRFIHHNHRNQGSDLFNRMAYTLQVGRDCFRHRLAFIAGDMDDLEEKMSSYLQGNTGIDGVFDSNGQQHGSSISSLISGKAGKEFLRVIMAERNLGQLAELWVCGVAVNWTRLYETGRPVRLPLPVYPFEKTVFRYSK
ncbi:MAG: hypothetical protein MI863_25950 [Desulfobacterales bacterium]|nr:hypothetical protein [Desulfobacterales bacterium]